MAIGELNPTQHSSGEDVDSCEEYDACFLDDSDEDPTFDAIEEARSELSKMTVKKSKPRTSRRNGLEVLDDEKDSENFEMVEKLITDGQLEKLKVDQCKVYLRKHGLRLTGNKDTLIARTREHLEVMDGGGEKKYPVSSFVLNCKGDACTGDVVMFEQTVYEMFNVASRSATGPPCGTRIVVGRIVKESYGAAKQQHTFTIEVLWSKGEKPLLALHPLLIKGRNLYRLKTMRQRWAEEEERRKVLQEKHARGHVARCSRENRILDKGTRKMGTSKRMKGNKSNPIPAEQQKLEAQHQPQPIRCDILKVQGLQPKYQIRPEKPTTNENGGHIPQLYKQVSCPKGNYNSCQAPKTYGSKPHFDAKEDHLQRRPLASWNSHFQSRQEQYHHQRQPVSRWPSPPQSSLIQQHVTEQMQHTWQQPCQFYRRGRCWFGDDCKYLHDLA